MALLMTPSLLEMRRTKATAACFASSLRLLLRQLQRVTQPNPQGMLDANGNWLTRVRPQHEGVPVKSFKSILTYGYVGVGLVDDTAYVRE